MVDKKIEYDRYSLKINGKRTFIWSGAIHYYRLPSIEQWKERIWKFKELGLNAIDVYYPWNYHSEKEGKYNFKGNRDVDLLMDEIEKAGLYLIARPGPYICSEIDGGGLPGWLIAKKDVIPRCRENGRFVYNEEFLKYTREWWEQIVPRIAKRKNLLLFQVENEYNLNPDFFKQPVKDILRIVRTYSPESIFKVMNSDLVRFVQFKLAPGILKNTLQEEESNIYVKELYDWSREMGIDVPIFHNDIMSTAGRVTDVDIMAIDDYAITDFHEDWKEKKHVFEALDVMEEGLESYRQDNPVFIAEFQGSWFDSWKGFGYDKIRKMLGVEQIDVATKSALFQRATLINYFMFSGGTTWGYLGSPDVYTSYDMASPISEWGEITARGEAVRKIIKDTAELGPGFLETDVDESVRCMTTNIYCRTRKANDGTRYVLLRNMTNKRKKCKIKGVEEKIVLDNAQACIVVLDSDGNITKKIEPYTDIAEPVKHGKHVTLPDLKDWKLSWGSPQLIDKYDASGWKLLTEEPDWDFDNLGHHYGYGWYRGTFRGRLKKIEVDARHCLSVYVNGKLVESKDNFRNTTGVGDDVAQEFEIYIPRGFQHGDMNVITILVESLGHNKDFECDVKNPRGIVSLKCYGAKVVWRFRGGLLEGEEGLTPVLPKKVFAQYEPKESVELPHFWEPYEEGIGLYETNVTLNVKNPDETPVGLVIPEAHSKANIYVNGYLIGRYWKEMGPQNKFFVPWGILKPKGKNHIAIAVWKRWEAGCLGKVRLEQY